MIKQIFDTISQESGDNAKIEILKTHSDNKVLSEVLYKALSGRVKFYINRIPEYVPNGKNLSIEWALSELDKLSSKDRLRGHAAILHLSDILSSVNSDTAYIVERIIDKRPKINMGRTQINKVFKGLIEKTPYMGAKPYSEKLVRNILKSGSAISQIKMDGRYANSIIRGGEVEIVSRAGEPNNLDGAEFLKEMSSLADEIVLNGEFTVHGVPVRRTANGIISSLIDIQKKRESRGPEETSKKEKAFLKKHAKDYGNENITFQQALDSVVYTCWDSITVDEYYDAKSTRPYKERFSELEKILGANNLNKIQLVESKVVNSFSEAMQHFQEALENDLEGTILKSLDGNWRNGKPSHQVKMKLDMNIDLKAVGFLNGNEGTKNEHIISRIQLESSCGKLTTTCSNMDEEMMNYVTENKEELVGSIVEVNCKGLSQNKDGDWSLMHPSIVEFRDDKDTCDSLESAQEIEESKKVIM